VELLILLIVGVANIAENRMMLRWYLLTNLGDLKQSIDTFKCRSGIEAMFKDCKTGGYNLEKSHANNQRLV
jgi:hypothetical protein